MTVNKDIIIDFFRYLWIVLGVAVLLFVLSQAIYTERVLEYDLDFSRSLSRDIRGWYPDSRIKNETGDNFQIVGEPVYMKIYIPVNFLKMQISGSLYLNNIKDVNLGLRQKDGSWKFRKLDLIDNNFFVDFDLINAQTKNNQLELILSIPDLSDSADVSLINNWKIILTR